MGRVLVSTLGDIYTSSPQGGQCPQGSPYLSNEDISTILLKAKKVESTIYVDIRPPYFEEVARKPYPVNYTPIIPKYDGIIGNAREQIRRYIYALMGSLL